MRLLLKVQFKKKLKIKYYSEMKTKLEGLQRNINIMGDMLENKKDGKKKFQTKYKF